jgi:hypothetical protein
MAKSFNILKAKLYANQRKFDSEFERKLTEGVLSHCEYHPAERIAYVVEQKYQVDWKYIDKQGKIYYIEGKGRFRDNSETKKYKWIRKVLGDNEELVFLFYDPKKAMPHSKPRKDGTKQTHSEWAEKNKFRWFTEYSIKELFND